MMLAEFTEPKLLLPQLLSESWDSSIAELSGCLATAGRIENAQAFTDAVLDHESKASATLPDVALSLARGDGIKELAFAMGLSRDGIRWGIGNAPTVHVVVLFAVPLSADKLYLSLLMAFSRLFKNETSFRALCQATQSEEMFAALNGVPVQ
jgi:mannitol/fructose-specific phosphotransferase system IIA component (Ntr-type)